MEQEFFIRLLKNSKWVCCKAPTVFAPSVWCSCAAVTADSQTVIIECTLIPYSRLNGVQRYVFDFSLNLKPGNRGNSM